MDTFCFLASTLSRASALSHETLPVTRIYHNSSCPHPRRAPQRVSAASGLSLSITLKNAPDDFGASEWLYNEICSLPTSARRCWK